jgi:hypothetical protein
MKKVNLIIGVIIVFILSYNVFAQTGGAAVDEIRTGTLSTSTVGNDTAQGGNVTMMNLSTTQTTTRWQGYYGNVSGSLSLGYGSDVFYDFSSSSISSVFVSQNETFDFTQLETAQAVDIDAVWGYASGVDRAIDIFTGSSSILGVSAPSVELEPTGSNFNSTILDDGNNQTKSGFAFGVNVQEPAVPCFDGSNCEYELMVPSDGQETYYFFLTI